MPRVLPLRAEPAHRHDQPQSIGVLYCNLGTPDAPTAPAVRRYLREFLGDPRVVEIPRIAWLPLLHGVILPLRSGRSAAKYASIWMEHGSPLAVYTQRQGELLQQRLGAMGHAVIVRHAMRYGSPSIASQLDALRAEGATRILVLPAYPQYSGTTTASVFDAVAQWGARARHLPELRFVHRWHDDGGYIEALARRIERHWREHGRGEHLVLSFHGVPQRTLRLGDPYFCECQKTARLLTARLQLDAQACSVSFQSRFGRAQWLQPYTEPTLRELAARGVRRVDVACPGFPADCLETLEEIGIEGKQAFLSAGGQSYSAIPCLNDDPAWIDGLAGIAERHLLGWPTQERVSPAALKASRDRALALGAES